MFAFIFHFRSFSPRWPLVFLIFSPPLWISMFFFLRNSSPLFSLTRCSSFSVIHAEKDTTLFFFLSKSLGGDVISFQIKPWVAFGLPYLLIELFYIGMPVVRTDGWAGGRSVGRSVSRCTVTWLPNFLGWVDYHISLAMGLRSAGRGAPLIKNRPGKSSHFNIGLRSCIWKTISRLFYIIKSHRLKAHFVDNLFVSKYFYWRFLYGTKFSLH